MSILDKIGFALTFRWLKKKAKGTGMLAVIKLLQGKKTHIIAVLALILGILQGFGIYTVPVEVWPVLGALGLSTLRAGVEKTAQEVKKDKKG